VRHRTVVRKELNALLQKVMARCTELGRDLTDQEFETVLMIMRILREHELGGIR
jgi:hypothetical protein